MVCRNGEQARRDKAVREVIVTKLREQLRTGGGKKLVGNRGYRRYLQAPAGSLQIDEAKIADEERYDGVWMLRVQGPFTAEEERWPLTTGKRRVLHKGYVSCLTLGCGASGALRDSGSISPARSWSR